jgi:hypothetical protein
MSFTALANFAEGLSRVSELLTKKYKILPFALQAYECLVSMTV